MTAVTLAAGLDKSYLLTDGGWYADDGTILHIGGKTAVCGRLKVAVANSGLVSTTFNLDEWLESQSDQRTLLAGIGAKLRDEVEKIAAAKAAYPGDFARLQNAPAMTHLFIAMWSDHLQEAQAFILASPGNHFGTAYTPYTVARVGEVVQPPVDRNLYPPRQAVDAAWAIPLIEAQRQTRAENGTYRVGCFAELITVCDKGIERRIIHRWRKDRIGKKIRPRASRKLCSW